MTEYEEKYRSLGYKLVCGVDEAGRGPLAGPVCAAAVILKEDDYIEGVNDSKKLSEKKREQLFDEITSRALSYSIVFVGPEDIDRINILNATMLAMKKAVESLSQKAEVALIDGNKAPELQIKTECIVKGDQKSASIAAASILAKVSRDRLLLELHEKHPMYHFDKHKGYGTKLHYEAIEKYGILPEHRKSFLKNILDR